MAARSTAQQDRIRRIGVLTALAESDPEGLPRAHFRQNSEKLFLLVFNADLATARARERQISRVLPPPKVIAGAAGRESASRLDQKISLTM